jgi:hypothetical protein
MSQKIPRFATEKEHNLQNESEDTAFCHFGVRRTSTMDEGLLETHLPPDRPNITGAWTPPPTS